MSFEFDYHVLDSPFIEMIWYTQSDQGSDFISTAESRSEIVISRCEGKTTVTVRGPETEATPVSAPIEGEFLGIVFRLGAYMPKLPPKNLMNRNDVHLPIVSHQSFWLDKSVWEIPNFNNADVFAARLVRAGLLVHDPVVATVLQGTFPRVSPRTLQYHFVRATGLPYKMIQQIDRAKQASALLQQGSSIVDTAYQTGYFDQAHLTNALKRFLGQTPAQIARSYQPAE